MTHSHAATHDDAGTNAGAYNKRCAHAGAHDAGAYAAAHNERCAHAGANDSGANAGADARGNAGMHRELMGCV